MLSVMKGCAGRDRQRIALKRVRESETSNVSDDELCGGAIGGIERVQPPEGQITKQAEQRHGERPCRQEEKIEWAESEDVGEARLGQHIKWP